jgi:hypothetical protein
VTEIEMITALLNLHPGVFWSAACAAACLIFTAGGTVVNFRYMKNSMVTKKDLEIVTLKLQQDMRREFVTRREFFAHDDKPNGRHRGDGRGQ